VRMLPPRDSRRGWDHPYSRPGGLSGKGGKGSGQNGKVGKSSRGNEESSSSSGQGGGGSPYPSRERERATRRIQQLQVSKWDRSPTPGDTSGEDPEEGHQVTVTPLSEMQHVFMTSVWDHYQGGETQELVQRHVE
jgi:hypothetical protein